MTLYLKTSVASNRHIECNGVLKRDWEIQTFNSAKKAYTSVYITQRHNKYPCSYF